MRRNDRPASGGISDRHAAEYANQFHWQIFVARNHWVCRLGAGEFQRYQNLKKLDPKIQGKYWWEIPPISPSLSEDVPKADPREALLSELSKEAILNEPILYLEEGIKKFVDTIGIAPYRLGYGRSDGQWNPLDRDEFLPSLADKTQIPLYCSSIVEHVFGKLFTAFVWLYPITIFFIAISYVAAAIDRIDQFSMHWSGKNFFSRSPVRSALLVAIGIPLSTIPLLGVKLDTRSAISSAVCLLLLALLTSVHHKSIEWTSHADRWPVDISLFSFLAGIFFGSLWLSWQIELGNSRNALAYLPFWSCLLGLAVDYWKQISRMSAFNAYLRTVRW